jgi:hypothetical protein
MVNFNVHNDCVVQYIWGRDNLGRMAPWIRWLVRHYVARDITGSGWMASKETKVCVSAIFIRVVLSSTECWHVHLLGPSFLAV